MHVWDRDGALWAMGRRDRSTKLKTRISEARAALVLARLKRMSKMNLTVKNQYPMNGSLALILRGKESLELKAVVAPGRNGEHLVLYSEFRGEWLDPLAADWGDLPGLRFRLAHRRPGSVVLGRASGERLHRLGDLVRRLEEAGHTVMVASPEPVDGLMHGHQLVTTSHPAWGGDIPRRIAEVCDFDLLFESG